MKQRRPEAGSICIFLDNLNRRKTIHLKRNSSTKKFNVVFAPPSLQEEVWSIGELDDIYFSDAEHNNSNQFLLPRVARENVFKLRESLVPRLGEEAKSKSSSKESSQRLEPSKIYKNYTTPNMIKWKWLLWKIWSCLQPIEAGHANSSDNGEKDFELDKRQDVPGAVF